MYIVVIYMCRVMRTVVQSADSEKSADIRMQAISTSGRLPREYF